MSLKFTNLSWGYKKNEPIVSNLNLEFYPNEVVAIIGPSGVGKTTIFNAILKYGILFEGEISFQGQNIYQLKKKQWKNYLNNVCLSGQKSYFLPEQTVFQNLVYSIKEYKNSFYKFFNIISKEQKQQIFDALDKFGILDKAFFKISDLSSGQEQRALLSKLSLNSNKIILADEPTNFLDNENAQLTMQYLIELAKANNSILLVNLHNLDLAKKYCDRIVAIKNGKIFFDKKINDITSIELENLYKNEK